MMQKIPMVIPNKERKVRSLFFHNSSIAILKLLLIISIVRRIMVQIYRIEGELMKILFKWWQATARGFIPSHKSVKIDKRICQAKRIKFYRFLSSISAVNKIKKVASSWRQLF